MALSGKIDLNEFDAIIFDMDGVLIDSEPLWKIAMEDVFNSVGCDLTRKDFQKTVGLRIDEVIAYWYTVRPWPNVSLQKVEEQIISRMVQLIEEQGKPLPGVLETLQFLQSNNKRIGLGTSSYTILIKTVLDTIGAAAYFDFVHSAEHELYGKPHPAVYMTVAKELGVHADRCLVIEDSFNGFIAGKAAKMKVVCIPEKTHQPDTRLNAADYLFEDMLQMLSNLA